MRCCCRFLSTVLLLSCTTAVPSVPPPVSANALELQHTLSAAATASGTAGTSVTIAPGTYVFSNTSLAVTGAANLDIAAHGVTLVFYYGFGLQLTSCTNVSLRGLTFDADPPNYAQGVLTGWNRGSSGDRAALAAAVAATVTFDEAFLLPDMSVQPFSQPGGLAGAKVRAAVQLY